MRTYPRLTGPRGQKVDTGMRMPMPSRTGPGTIHAEIAERVALAQSYAEDGAFLSAARIYREIAAKLEERHRATTPR